MNRKGMSLLLCLVLLVPLYTVVFANERTAEENRNIILFSNHLDEVRNQLWAEDILHLQNELPKLHKNLFYTITKDEFLEMTNALLEDVGTLENPQVFVRLGEIIAAVGDAHTTIDYWDGHLYPLSFWLLSGDLYIIDTSDEYDDMRYAKVLLINGIGIEDIIWQLTSLIPHENENWLTAILPEFIQKPIFMYGLGLIPDESRTLFTIEKDGEVKTYTVDILNYQGAVQYFHNHTGNSLTGAFDVYYAYEYMAADHLLYLQYNVCADAQTQSFVDFCTDMFAYMDDLAIDTIVVDLRNNKGGNSEIFNAFTDEINGYMKRHPETTLYIAIGRNTFSSGVFALLRTKKAVPEAIVIGQATGGAVDGYGDTRSFVLPTSQLPVTYSTKHFELSDQYQYSGDPLEYMPDIVVPVTIEDFCNGTDPVLDYIRAN